MSGGLVATPSVGQQRDLRRDEGGLGLVVAAALAAAAAADAGTATLTLLLGGGQLCLGVIELVAVVRAAHGARGRTPLFVAALLSTVFGAYILGYGGSTVDRLRVAMAMWFAVIALGDLATARTDRPSAQHAAVGVAGLLLAGALAIGAWELPALAWLLAVAFAVRAAHELVLARRAEVSSPRI
jgi:uncharacterized membrane protein HdeD (DUF308 family)